MFLVNVKRRIEKMSTDELYGQSYDLPENRTVIIDESKGEIIERSELTVFQNMKLIAEQNGYVIKDPKTGCKKCYGRGYIGKDFKTQMPIPCNCIYPARTDNEQTSENIMDAKAEVAQPKASRKQRRDYKKRLMKYISKNKKSLMAEVAAESKVKSANDSIENIPEVETVAEVTEQI